MSFVSNESGAVTVDWVVLTASLVGLGLAVTAVVSGGIRSQANDIEETMQATLIVTRFGDPNFDGPRTFSLSDWVGGAIRNVPGIGQMVALASGNGSTELEFSVSDRHDYAVIEFDMSVIDSWDSGDSGRIMVDGVGVVEIGHNHLSADAPTVQTFGTPGAATVQLTRASTDTGTWDTTAHTDYTYRVRVVAENTGRPMTLGASATMDQGVNDEMFGVGNVRVSGTDTP